MKTRNMAIAALLGLGLLGATMLLARNAAGTAAASVATPVPVTRSVAAEGRVVAYPGAEVRVSAEWSGHARTGRRESESAQGRAAGRD